MSPEEQAFINETFLSGDDWESTQLWIGLSEVRQEDVWEWSTGESFSYSNWDPGEPNDWFGDEDYVIINWAYHTIRGGWNDFGKFGNEAYYGIIELEPHVVPEPSSIIAWVSMILTAAGIGWWRRKRRE